MPKPAFSRIALIGKHTPEIAESLRALRGLLRSRGCEVRVERETAERIGDGGDALELARMGDYADLAIVLGGDGTMLAAARSLAPHGVPLTGINQGRVGFMTDIALRDMQASVGAILDGDFRLEERALIDAEIVRGGASILRTVALNEAVLGKGAEGRLIEFEVRIDGEYVYDLRADGLIVATPTGSTAYALSAQGPILHPGVGALALVPLNPHVLSARPVSVSDRCVIEVSLLGGLDARAHFDGLALTELAQGDRLVLRRAKDSVRFVHPPSYSYFAMLREKLSWSEAAERGSEQA